MVRFVTVSLVALLTSALSLAPAAAHVKQVDTAFLAARGGHPEPLLHA